MILHTKYEQSNTSIEIGSIGSFPFYGVIVLEEGVTFL